MAGQLDGKVAVITGGTSGIGQASVERFVVEGARVVVGDIQDQAGKELADRHPGQVSYVHTDVTEEAQIEALIDATVHEFGTLDVMFNNAGAAGDPSLITELTPEGFDDTVALLARSVLLGHKHAARRFQQQGTGGSIISTSSAAGFQGGWSTAGYTISKHAVLGVVRQSVAELAPLGVRSNAICPGVVATPIMARTFGIPAERAEEFSKYMDTALGDVQPIGRLGRAEDIANVAVFLASDAAQLITGAGIPVDGGATAVTQNGFGQRATQAGTDFLAELPHQ